MKKLVLNSFAFLIILASLSSCATMFGGSKYYATFEVENHESAHVKVSGYGQVKQGEKVKLRRHGSKTVTIQEVGCEKVTRTYKNTFNATTVVNVPFNFALGVGIDAATGAMFKPQLGTEVYKKRRKHFEYVIADYDKACKSIETQDITAAK